MTSRIRIQCINKLPRSNPHERIKNIGGVNSDGKRWKLTLAEAITHTENKTYQFFVHEQGREVNVIVATHLGHKYLKTVADGVQPDNLLSLPECP